MNDSGTPHKRWISEISNDDYEKEERETITTHISLGKRAGLLTMGLRLLKLQPAIFILDQRKDNMTWQYEMLLLDDFLKRCGIALLWAYSPFSIVRFPRDEIYDEEETIPSFEFIVNDEDEDEEEEENWFFILIWCVALIYIEIDCLNLVLVFIYTWDRSEFGFFV